MKYRLVVLTLTLLCGITALAQSSGSPDAASRAIYQRAMEQVYWQHRIWPVQNTSPVWLRVDRRGSDRLVWMRDQRLILFWRGGDRRTIQPQL